MDDAAPRPLLSLPEAAFRAEARRRLAATGAPGPSPLDVTSSTVLNFAQGSFALVARDLAALCADDAAAAADGARALARARVADAFCARRARPRAGTPS